MNGIQEVNGSIPSVSTKQVLDEHLFLQRRLRRKVFALIHNRKAPSWKTALFYYNIDSCISVNLRLEHENGIIII